VIVLENTDYNTAMADTYLGTTLTSKGRLLTNYLAIGHPSQPNYIAMVSGSTNGISNDTPKDVNAKNIVDLLEAKGVSWGAYDEDYTGSCNKATSLSGGLYYRKHNPLISFTDISGNPTRCANIKPATDLQTDITNKQVPSYVFFTPNMNDDGHDTDVSTASSWLNNFLEPLLANSYFDKTVFLITFDENETQTAANQVYAVLVGGPVSKGTQDGTAYTHYSQLATVEKIFGLGNLGLGDVNATPFTI